MYRVELRLTCACTTASAEAVSDDGPAAPERALDRSLAQADAGQLVEADEVLAERRSRRPWA